MKNMLDGVEDVLLMGPGPSYISDEVYEALRKPTLGHLDPYFIEIMDEIRRLQQKLMQTENKLTFPVSGTGSAGMEAVFVNLIEKGDPVLILINGVFGTRMKDVAERLGAEVDALEFTWGTPVDVNEVEAQLKKKDYTIAAVVHAETSTGVRNPVDEIAELLRGTETYFIVDTVTSLGGIPVKTDEWGAGRCSLQRLAEVPLRPARPLPGDLLRPRGGEDHEPQHQGAQLVPGHEHDRQLLGQQEAGLSPHRTDQHALRSLPQPTDDRQ